MIVPMKRVTIVALSEQKRSALKALRKASLVHLDSYSATSATIEALSNDKSRLEKELQKLAEIAKSEKLSLKEVVKPAEFEKIHNEVASLISEQELIDEALKKATIERDRLKEWGEFSIEDLKELKERGYLFNFYLIGTKEFQRVKEDYEYIILNDKNKTLLVATLEKEFDESVTAQKMSWPKKSLNEINDDIDENKIRLKEIQNRLSELAHYCESYKYHLALLKQDLTFENATEAMKEDDTIAYISGFLPANEVESFKKVAKKEEWAYAITEPTEEDEVPTQIKNKKWISIIEPVFDILGTVPGYREYDISMWFLIFFALFFAMIVGDGAYGLIFLTVAIVAHRKMKKANNAIILLYVLSIANIIWGALTGTWFGSKAILEAVPFLQAITIPQIANYPELFGLDATTAQYTVMKFCFIVGTLQLALACAMNIYRKIGSKYLSDVADFGWLIMLLALYFLVLMLVIGATINTAAVATVVGLGFLLVIFFGAQGPDVPFVKGLLGGLGGLFSTFLDTISAFSNIISYIRLFAVGMASLAIAQSFNSMASGMLHGFAIPAGVLILVIGHGLNLIMALLSVVVHGVRLNLLEFSGQLGMEWTGINYDPFRETVKK